MAKLSPVTIKASSPVLLGVLRGVFCFMADLMREITLPLSMDFMSVSYYGGNGNALENGAVQVKKGPDIPIEGRHVVLVEDIVDTGMTLNYLLRYLHSLNPADVKVCALLDKKVRRLVDVKLDYVGFEIADEFVVGYGLDYLGEVSQPAIHRDTETRRAGTAHRLGKAVRKRKRARAVESSPGLNPITSRVPSFASALLAGQLCKVRVRGSPPSQSSPVNGEEVMLRFASCRWGTGIQQGSNLVQRGSRRTQVTLAWWSSRAWYSLNSWVSLGKWL